MCFKFFYNLQPFFSFFFLQSVTITVTNSDTVNDVINMSLLKLGITVSYLQVIFVKNKLIFEIRVSVTYFP